MHTDDDQYEFKSHYVQQGAAFVHLLLASAKYYFSVDFTNIRQWGVHEVEGDKSDRRGIHSHLHFVDRGTGHPFFHHSLPYVVIFHLICDGVMLSRARFGSIGTLSPVTSKRRDGELLK
jgi:hypothetical protein